jgi:hypothetical protein
MRTYGKLLAAALALSALPLLYACEGVTPPETETLSPAYAKIAVGGIVQFQTPAKPRGRMVEWASGDPEVAEVSGDGWVTGLKPGGAIIRGDCGQYCPTALVVVIDPVGPQDPDPETGGAK